MTKNLRLIAKIHYNLCKLSKIFNRQFNGIIVLIIATGFPLLSSSFYFIFVRVQSQDKTDYFRVGVYISWQFIYALSITVIVIACNSTTNQVIC